MNPSDYSGSEYGSDDDDDDVGVLFNTLRPSQRDPSSKNDSDVFPVLVTSLHSAFDSEIRILCDNKVHQQIETDDYVKRHLLAGQRRFLESMRPASSAKRQPSQSPLRRVASAAASSKRAGNDVADGDEEDELTCDFGKLRDIKAVFDHYQLAKDFLKQRFLNSRLSTSGVAASMMARVQSAPTTSSKLTQMQLGLHHNTRGPLASHDGDSGTVTHKSGAKGIPEKVFLERVAPIMCATYPQGTASWYNSIDTNNAGSVTWVKFARYLQTYYEAVRAKAERDATLSQHVRYDDIPLGRLQRGPPYRAIQVKESRTQFFVLCTDGCVRAVSKETMKAVDLVHYADHGDPHPIDIKVQQERNQLYVCLPNGFVFVYDTTGHLTRQGNVTRVFRIGDDHPYNDRGWDKGGGIAVMQKLTKFDPLHMQLPDNGSRYREMPTAIVTGCDVFPLSLHAHCRCGATRVSLCICGGLGVVARGQLTCIDPYQETPGSKDQLFFAGFEHGHIALYRPPAVCPVVHAPRKASFMVQPHTDRMTCLRYCNTFPDLRGLLTSSEGGRLSLLDVDTAEVVVTFRDHQQDLADGGGWVNGCRPVHAFDVSQQMPIIGSCGHMRGVTLWSATMRRKIGSFHDHRGPVHSLCFHQNAFHLITIGGDRTMRVWDIRTMKPVQVIVDRERVDSQPFGVVSYDSTTERVVAWTGAPYVYPLVDDHVASHTAKDLSPVSCMLIVEDELQKRLAVGSGTSLSIWDLNTGALEIVLEVGAHIDIIVLDPSGKKLFMAVAGCTIVQYVVGSQVLSGKTRVIFNDASEQATPSASAPRNENEGPPSSPRHKPTHVTSMIFVQKSIGRSRRKQHGVAPSASLTTNMLKPVSNTTTPMNMSATSAATASVAAKGGPSFLLIGTSSGSIVVMSDRLGGATSTPLQIFRVDQALDAYNKIQRRRNLDKSWSKLAPPKAKPQLGRPASSSSAASTLPVEYSSDDDAADGKQASSLATMDACGEVTALQHTTTSFGDFVIAGTAGGVVAIVCLEYDGNMVLQKIDQHRSLLDRLSSPSTPGATVSLASPVKENAAASSSLLGNQRNNTAKLSLPLASLASGAQTSLISVNTFANGTAGIPPRSSSAPLAKTAALWKRALSATRKEREGSLNARAFTHFRYSAQERMQVHVDDVVVLPSCVGMSVSSTTHPAMYSPRGGLAASSVATIAPLGLPLVPLSARGEGNPLADAPPVDDSHTGDLEPTTPALSTTSVMPSSSPLAAYQAQGLGKFKPQSQLDSTEEPMFVATLTAAGDCKLLCASTRSSLEEEALPESLGSFPATTVDGCGGQIAVSGECLWVADDSGHLSEFRIAIADIQAGAPLLFKGGCKYSLRVQVELIRVTRFSCGIRAIVIHEQCQIVVLGLESGRCCALSSVDGAHRWGQPPVTGDLTPKELLLKHRFQFCFKPVPSAFPSPDATDPSSPLSARGGATRKFQGIAKAVSRMIALRPPDAAGIAPLPAMPALSGSSTTTTITAPRRDAFLAIVMKDAPARLKKGVVSDKSDDEGEADADERTAKAAALRFRDRSDGANDVSRACFSRLKLNDVSNVLQTRPASAASMTVLNPVQSRTVKKKRF